MKRHRELIMPNIVALPVLLVVLLAGWREAAAFGLAVLVLMDLLVLLRERGGRAEGDNDQEEDNHPEQGEIQPGGKALT